MAVIRPFCAIRPAANLSSEIASLPYDVYSTEEARERTKDRPLSFLRIDRAEVNFPEGMDPYQADVYQKAHDLFWEEVHEGDYQKDQKPGLYLYELTMQGRVQTGLVALTSVDDYEKGIIKRHEDTLEAKENDRVRHIDIVNAQTGPVFLVNKKSQELKTLLEAQKTKEQLLFDFTTDQKVRQRGFAITDPTTIDQLKALYRELGSLYICDGHHRAAAAVKVCEKRRKYNPHYTGNEEFNYFLSVIFSEDEVKSLDYNRVFRSLNDLDRDEFLASLLFHCDIQPVLELGGMKQMEASDPKAAMDQKHHEFLENTVRPKEKGSFSLYVGGRWYLCKFHEDIRSNDPVEGLDVALLQKYVCQEILGIENPRTDPKIDYVGGIHGLEELENRCEKDCLAAIAMYPTSLSELMQVADLGRRMPPKSTWFEPKLLSGLFIHSLED